jgi:tetratricopeptide (TPR) repeat protein
VSEPDARRARLLRDAGSVRSALEEAGRVMMTAPDDPEALTVVADARRRLGDLRGGLAAAERAAAIARDDPDTFRALAFARLALRDRDGAIAAARRALDLAPGNPAILGNLATVLLDAGRRRDVWEALSDAEAALAAAPDDYVAQDVFRRVLAEAPQDFLARHNLAVVTAVRGLESRAAGFARFVLRRDRGAALNALLALSSAIALVVAAIDPRHWTSTMIVGVSLLAGSVAVGLIRARRLRRVEPSHLVDS